MLVDITGFEKKVMDFLFKCKKCPNAFSTSTAYRKHICQSTKNQRTDIKTEIGVSISEDAELRIKDDALIKITEKKFKQLKMIKPKNRNIQATQNLYNFLV